MISIKLQHGVPLVWSVSDWEQVRKEHRIVGNLIGCSAALPRQDTFQGLPLKLLHEEVTLLLEKDLACIVKNSDLIKHPNEEKKKKYLKYKEQNRKEQLECYEAQRKQQIASMIDRIIEGKRRKMLGINTKKFKPSLDESSNSEDANEKKIELEIDREEVLKNELSKSSATVSPPLLVQTFTKDPWIDESNDEKVPWHFPETEHEKLKYRIFKDLWEKGFYITEGHKFGVDYLVYPGDPVKFHAQFLIVCKEYDKVVSKAEIISYARLGSISRKTFVIASILPDHQDVLYHSIQWTGKS